VRAMRPISPRRSSGGAPKGWPGCQTAPARTPSASRRRSRLPSP
jgi:hypothetical protein